jgi:radical SAM protein with 4Fe4S-binding SPASM domain
MTAELHEKVLQELVAVGFKGRIAYHNNSEPLIFRELPQFVARARALLPESHIQILSNGRSLTLQKADVLIQAGIDELSINYYNDDFTVELPKVLRAVVTDVLPKHFTPDQLDVTGVGSDSHGAAPKFKYQVIRRRETDILDSRAGTSPNKRLPNGGPRGFCQYPWTQLIVSADGRVPMCCADLNISESVGNASHQTVLEIWHGDRLHQMREALWRGDRQAISTCRQCDFFGVKKTPTTLMGRLVDAMTR